jgi:hypothetical protein
MPAFTSTPAPTMTLWGAPDTTDERLPGVWHVTTPSHGGFVLSDERQAAMPDSLRFKDLYYEEDVNWSLVVLAFEDELRQTGDPLFDLELSLAHQTARNWLPDAYGAFTGQVIEPRDSYVLKRQRAYETAIGKLVVVSAFGDWADWVPAGKVGLIGQRLQSVNHLGFPTYGGAEHCALVDADRYDSGRTVNTFEDIGAEIVL